jgi:outer membrane murein-binding lipoprotein Lpp
VVLRYRADRLHCTYPALPHHLRTSCSNEEVKERVDNVQKLAAENEKLAAELKAMDERLQAMERRTQELEKQKRGESTRD